MELKIDKVTRIELMTQYQKRSDEGQSDFLCLFIEKVLGPEYRERMEAYLVNESLIKGGSLQTIESLFREDDQETENSREMANVLRPMVLEHFMQSLAQ